MSKEISAENFSVDKSTACCFTGHRELENDFSLYETEKTIDNLIERGFKTFLVGMAVGFDAECFRILEKKRETFPITIVACIPCRSQDAYYTFSQKEKYKKMVASSDFSVVLSETYTPYCMMKRNMFMVDNCSVLVAYLRTEKGGTFNTVKYAEKKNVTIIKL